MSTMNGVEKITKSVLFSLPEYSDGYSGSAAAAAAAVEMDQESNGSSVEDVESPRSVVNIKKQPHNQILRIRAEDSHLGKDIGEGNNLSLKLDKYGFAHFMVFSRPILPASPLRGKSINHGQRKNNYPRS